MQYHDNKPRVVAYGSRALTAVEQRYRSQLEREALAVVWSCEYFHLYIFGAPVQVVTDHKPLVTLYGNPSTKLPLRLERWAMRLLPYQPVIEFRRGRDNNNNNNNNNNNMFISYSWYTIHIKGCNRATRCNKIINEKKKKY